METVLLIPLLKGNLKIDGELNEPVYKSATPITQFYTVFPEGSEPFPGKIFLFHDGRNLYVSFRFTEPYGIRANVLERDRVWGNLDNLISIRIGTGSSGYMFSLNPLGTPSDCRIINYDNPICTWDYNWEYSIHRAEKEWWGEIRIPLEGLSLSDTVQIKIVRQSTLPDEMGSYQITCTYPTDRSHLVDLRYAHRAVFEGGLKTSERIPISILPSITLIHAHPAVEMIYPQIKGSEFFYNAGVDLNVKLNNASISATIFPDFSQVEADVGQLNLQKASIIVLPEKRPFFYEGFELFKTPMEVLYTRAFVTIRGAAKYSIEGNVKSQGFAIYEDSLGMFYGFAMGYTRRGRNLTGILIHHERERKTLMDGFYRRILPGGLRASIEGTLLSDGGYGFAARLNRYVSGEGLSFSMDVNSISQGFQFPTVPLPFGSGILEGGFWANYKKVLGGSVFTSYRIEGAYRRRNLSYGSMGFLNEMKFGEISVQVLPPVFLGYNFSIFTEASGRYNFHFHGPRFRLGSTFDRAIFLEYGRGEMYGFPAWRLESYVSYTFGRWKVGLGREEVRSDNPDFSKGNTHVSIRYRAQRGIYLTLFYQKNENVEFFPQEEGQAIVGYEWGGRSRIFLVFRPFKQNNRWNFQTFFKITYQFDM